MPPKGGSSALIDKINLDKIHRSTFWLQHCAQMSALQVCEAVIDLQYIGGVYGDYKVPCPYFCLLCRMLTIQPSLEFIVEMCRQDVHKYLRVFGVHYLRWIASKGQALLVHDDGMVMNPVTDADDAEKAVSEKQELQGDDKEPASSTSGLGLKKICLVDFISSLQVDYRKIRLRDVSGDFVLTHVDEVLDELLRKDSTSLWGVPMPSFRTILQ